jgi:hypothetical protein
VCVCVCVCVCVRVRERERERGMGERESLFLGGVGAGERSSLCQEFPTFPALVLLRGVA